MKYFLILLIALPGLYSCNESPAEKKEAMAAHMDSLKTELLQADIDFSKMSEDKGRNAAYGKYAADNATLLRPFSRPVTGKNAIDSFYKLRPDASYVLIWKPIRADVGSAGDIGYTYGTYTLSLFSLGQERGTYCSVWKKDTAQQWKFVLHAAVKGLNPDDEAAYRDKDRDWKNGKK